MAKRLKNGTSKDGWIEVKGARTHNLQNIDVKIPRGLYSLAFPDLANQAWRSTHCMRKDNAATSRASVRTQDSSSDR